MKTVLLVDDDLDVCSEFQVFLEHKGFEVMTSGNALDALRCFRSKTPDIVLTDYRMPELTGLDLLKDIKQLKPEIPVVLMSGDADMRTAVDAIKADAFDFLRKPISSAELMQVLQAALKRAEISDNEDGDELKSFGPILHQLVGKDNSISLIRFNGALEQRNLSRVSNGISKIKSEGILKKRVIFTFSDVDYINNVGLNFLVDLWNRLQAEGFKLVFAQPSSTVRSYLNTLGYLKYFSFVNTLEEAIETI